MKKALSIESAFLLKFYFLSEVGLVISVVI
ncbi:MAG: Uncharacterised protein [Cryomorphaceae bacterium]|nr:MAG: Uncharacterised protein [Cryomorphaceae bacterium]